MNKTGSALILSVLFSSLVAASSLFAAPKLNPQKNLQKIMHSLSEPLIELSEFASSPERFGAAKNRKKINQLLKVFADKTHSIQTQTKPGSENSDFDPTAEFQIKNLKETIHRTQVELKRGNSSYASALARTIPQACVGCHARLDTGAQFSMSSIPPQVKKMNFSEQITFLTALRHYDAAQEIIEKVLKDEKSLKQNPIAWENALNQGLIISTRVKKDPVLAMKLIDAVLSQKALPVYLITRAEKWKSSIEAWSKEVGRKIKTPEGMLAEGKRLFALSLDSQKYPMDRAGWIYLLRSTEVLHRLMRTEGNQPQISSEASFLLGTAYETLWGIGDSALHEIYFETCIRKTPHSPIAHACYSRLEDGIINSFTGSTGTDVPMDVEKNLIELKLLALPQKSSVK